MPVASAIATYFDNVYTPGSAFGSVGSGFMNEDGSVLAYVAFKAPPEAQLKIDTLLRSVADMFDSEILVDDPNPFGEQTH